MSIYELLTEHFGNSDQVSYEEVKAYLEELLEGHTIQTPTARDCLADWDNRRRRESASINLTLTITLRDGTVTRVDCPFSYHIDDPWSAVQNIENIVLDEKLIDGIATDYFSHWLYF